MSRSGLLKKILPVGVSAFVALSVLPMGMFAADVMAFDETGEGVWVNDNVMIISEGFSADTIRNYTDKESIEMISFDGETIPKFPEDCSDLFSGYSSVEHIDIIVCDTSGVTNMSGMFEGCSSLTDIGGLWDWNTQAVTDMSSMFEGCSSLTSIGVDDWKTQAVTDMSSMFEGCSKLKSIGVNGWNTQAVTDMSSMFEGCSSLTDIGGLWDWNTQAVTDMSSMFEGCSSLTGIAGLWDWNTQAVTDMSSMFEGCSSLTSIGVDDWKTQAVTDMSSMFEGCSSLGDLALDDWKTQAVTDMSSMFEGCSSLESIAFDGWKTQAVTDMSSMFEGCSSLSYIEVDGWDTQGVTDMSSMFKGCSELQSIRVNGWDTQVVTDMSNMFSGCSSLGDLDLDGWDTSSVTDMSNMFSDCSSLSYIDVDGWVTENVTDMSRMFKDCSLLTSIVVDGWNTENVKDMSRLFYKCSSLTSIGVSNWKTDIVTDMAAMFYGCNQLQALDVSGWDISNVTDMRSMFGSCSSLISIGVDGWNTNSVTIMNGMFYGCSSLTEIGVDDWDTSSVKNMGWLFCGCSSLSYIGVEGWVTENVTDMTCMFTGCSSLNTLDLTGFDVSGVTAASSMFLGCSNATVYVSTSWNISTNGVDQVIVVSPMDVPACLEIIGTPNTYKGDYVVGSEVMFRVKDGYPVGSVVFNGNVCAAVDGVYTITICNTNELTVTDPVVTSPFFSAHGMELKSEIGVRFCVTVPEDFDGTGCYIDFAAADGRTGRFSFSDGTRIGTTNEYYFVFGINALGLADEITATLQYGDGLTITDTYSAMKYIKYIEANYGKYNKGEELLALVDALHDYGYYLQKSGWTDGGTHTDIAAPVKNLDNNSIDSAIAALQGYRISVTGDENLDGNVKVALTLNARTDIRVSVKPADGVSITSDGYTKRTINSDIYYQFRISDISVTELGEAKLFHIETTGGEVEVTVSAMYYVKAALASSAIDENGKYALTAFYDYWQAAQNYK
ncbi:BspA family leucine-rich repeat surface protein [Butyrivibrio sp. AE2032]|uniref:BspA family leucine-rich repeat surface protein n=1 Tax=Butyrivibrio sp. AE2032 TaxID=1458463 RepID=UPI000689EA9C|nr:BspA family leucine-rich repeat surface protein [Butyrivibrio sp. AE2032]